jgi:hypothetical protein
LEAVGRIRQIAADISLELGRQDSDRQNPWRLPLAEPGRRDDDLLQPDHAIYRTVDQARAVSGRRLLVSFSYGVCNAAIGKSFFAGNRITTQNCVDPLGLLSIDCRNVIHGARIIFPYGVTHQLLVPIFFQYL